MHGDRPGRHLSELAYHYAEAAPLGEVDKAVSYAIRAGEHAHAQLAFEESVRSYERALECLALRETPSDDQCCELLLRLGEVRFLAGEFERSKATFLEAAALAERIGDAGKLGAAALGYGGGLRMTFDSTAPTETLMTLFDKALKALEGTDSALRAKIMVRRAVAMQTSRWTGAVAGSAPRQSDAEALAREAIAMAQRVGDREAFAFVLGAAAWAIQSPESLDERLMLLDGALTVVRELKNPKFEIFIRMLLSQYHVETGDMDRATAEAAVVEATPDAEHDPYVRWLITAWRASCAFLEGRADDAEKHIGEGLSLGEESGNRDALAIGYAQLMIFRLLQGRTDEAMRGLVNLANRYSDVAYFRIIQLPEFAAFDLFEPRRMAEEARASMQRALANVLQQRILDRRLLSWMAEACGYAEVAAVLEDRDAAAMLYEQLLPFENRCATVARFIFIGSVARSLGVLATALDRFDDAERHFEAAMATNRRLRARPFVAYGAMNYATMLMKRAKPGDRERALALLGEAIELLQQLPMKRFLEAAVALRLKAQGVGLRDVKGSIHAIADSIETKKPDLSAHAAPDGTVTLLFSDVEGFSAMTDRLGDRRAHEIMREHHDIVRRELRAHGGYEVELMGDGFLLAFSSARRGLDCAIAIQKSFAAYNEKHPEEPLRVRMGLHTGEAIREAHKFFGKAVILAARIAAHARGGEILVSALFHELTKSGSDVPFGPIREVELKGLAGAHGVCPVGWDGRVPQEIVETAAAPQASADNSFRKTGDFWTIAFEGESLTMRDAKGLNYIARLLADPGRELHVFDLIGGGNGALPAGATAKSAEAPVGDLGSAGELLDPQARAEYRARLDELKSELDDAEGANDVGRAARLREEMEFLSQELSAAFGLGGRARKASDATERARKAVSGRINESVARIRKEHAALGAHLTNAIRLGTFCEYRPERPTTWELSNGDRPGRRISDPIGRRHLSPGGPGRNGGR